VRKVKKRIANIETPKQLNEAIKTKGQRRQPKKQKREKKTRREEKKRDFQIPGRDVLKEELSFFLLVLQSSWVRRSKRVSPTVGGGVKKKEGQRGGTSKLKLNGGGGLSGTPPGQFRHFPHGG